MIKVENANIYIALNGWEEVMATVQELQDTVAELKSALDSEKTQVAAKITELEKKLEAATIPDEVVTGLRATIDSIKAIVEDSTPETPAAPAPAPEIEPIPLPAPLEPTVEILPAEELPT